MKITANLQHGSIDAEFVADDREELEKDILGFATFLSDNSELFGKLDVSENGGSSGGIQVNGETAIERSSTSGGHPLSSLSGQIGVPVDALDELVYVDPNGEEDPQVLVEKGLLGGSVAERQRNAAYLLLYVWDECYDGEERMKTADLKTLLSVANISDNNLYNAWKGPGKGDFNPTGRGESATVGLTGPGKRKAIKVIKQLAEQPAE